MKTRRCTKTVILVSSAMSVFALCPAGRSDEPAARVYRNNLQTLQ